MGKLKKGTGSITVKSMEGKVKGKRLHDCREYGGIGKRDEVTTLWRV